MRNEMHSFAATPSANIPRSRFNMPCNIKFTGNTGRLIPFYVCEVLPGDTFEVSTSVVCRMQTLIHPLMDNIYLDTYYFYVPNRLVWDNWKHFCGEPNKAWVPDREWTIPTISINCMADENETADEFLSGKFKDSLVDYMGIGFNRSMIQPHGPIARAISVNALPIRAYNKIYDDWFRDENLIDPINLYTGDNNVTLNDWIDPLTGGKPYMAAKLHDYFTSALPQAQRGNPVTLTMGDGMAPVVPSSTTFSLNNAATVSFNKSVGHSAVSGALRINNNDLLVGGTSVGGDAVYPNNLYANLNGISTGITINDLRMAFQVQKFMERSARGGARYIELLKSMFGVTSPDARLQRSEYLGGHRVPINIHQIANTAETTDSPLGSLGALSVTSDVHNDFIHSFTEHGFVIGICVVRYKHTYPTGMDRFWSRKTKFDYYWPVFASIGEQPIKDKEIFVTYVNNNSDSVFGYQEAWADYRYKPNRVMGEMRPGIPSSLASWHLADNYTTTPILSKDWIEEDPVPVDRAIAVTSNVADQFLFDVLVNNNATRPMPLYSVPGLVDHF